MYFHRYWRGYHPASRPGPRQNGCLRNGGRCLGFQDLGVLFDLIRVFAGGCAFGGVELLQHQRADLLRHLSISAHELRRALLTLTQTHLTEREPRTRLSHHPQITSHLHPIPLRIDTPPEDDSHLRLPGTRRHLVLRSPLPHPVTHPLRAHLHITLTPDLHPHAGVELHRPPARRRLRVAVKHFDLLPDLVDEQRRGTRLTQSARQLPQSLTH